MKKPELDGMGTTMITVGINDNVLSWAHVGDSRLYIYHKEILQQVTTDHSFVMELLKKARLPRMKCMNIHGRMKLPVLWESRRH